MPSDIFTERILRLVQAKGYKPQQLQKLAQALDVGEREQGDFHAACKALMKTGRIVLGSRDAVMLPEPPGKLVGIYRGNSRGFGFVVPDTPNSHGDLFIPAGGAGGAITGDTVRAGVKKRGKRGGKLLYEGRIVEVLKRGQNRFVGALDRKFQRWFVVPDGKALHVPIMVDDPSAKSAKPGDQVVVEIIDYPTAQAEARGVIIKVLGPQGDPDVDTLSIIEQHQLPGDFDQAVDQETRKVVAAYDPDQEAANREDLRKLTIITIDPADARDFDDAISLTANPDGTVELGVHIADVSHFVREETPLDDEAKDRATSIYLPRRVIPMLPEVLSNGVCSLQERQPRLTKSAFITYDKQGKVKKNRVANTIIRSTKRLTYEQASAVLEGKKGRLSAKVVALIKEMETLARTIRKRRLKEGMLVLDLPDAELVFGEDGKVVDVKPADQSFSHTIIEMFMVEANEAVARILTDKNLPFLRRIHDEPNESALESLADFLAALGHELPESIDRFVLKRLLERVGKKAEAFTVNLAVLRSMKRAEYAPLRIGHYALSSKNYCHFTSPIRRYPDLTVHRLIDGLLGGEFDGPGGLKRAPSERHLIELGRHCSDQEHRAESAERELKLVLTLRLLQKHLGEECGGVVAGVANVGVFVQLDHYLVEGLLSFDDLGDDWWDVDASTGSVVGERSGCRISIGDRLKVGISRIDVPNRQLNLMLAQPLPGKRGAKPGKRPTASTGKRSGGGRAKVKKKRKHGRTRKRPGRRR